MVRKSVLPTLLTYDFCGKAGNFPNHNVVQLGRGGGESDIPDYVSYVSIIKHLTLCNLVTINHATKQYNLD